MKTRICSICNREVDVELFDYHVKTEEHLLKKILEQYPAWEGSSDKILWYYRSFILPSNEGA